MKKMFCASVLLAILLTTSTVLALDIVRMHGGRAIEGEIVAEDYDCVRLKTSHGVVELSKEDIDSIERDLDLDKEFENRFGKAGSASDFYELGLWCEDYKRAELAKKCYEKAIKLDPSHAPSRTKLGYKEHQGKWYTEEEYNREVRGLVLHEGEWISKSDKDMLDAGYVKVDGEWVSRDEAPDPDDVRRLRKAEEDEPEQEKSTPPRPAHGSRERPSRPTTTPYTPT
jgi:tetratricopeptide (TPR) repeat protein